MTVRPVPRRRAPGPAGPATMEWQRLAACAGEDPDLFFPADPAGEDAPLAAEARRVCARCPVLEECYEWALGTGQRTGVWGGETATQRRSVRRPGDQRPAGAALVRTRPGPG
jgi:WhiB family transcriptional regulator, redox-sensing transcriptional regulator